MDTVNNTQEKKRRVGRPKTHYKTPGRKLLLDAKMLLDMQKFISEGYNIQDTCTMLGIGVSTYYSWIEDAENDIAIGKHSIKVEMLEVIKKAEITYIHQLQENIRIAGFDPNKWQANAWLLERKRPSEFGLKQEETTKDETPLAINVIITDKKNPDKIKQMEKTLE